MKSLNRKIISILLVLIFVFSPVFANKAEAQWAVYDLGNLYVNSVTAVNTTVSASTDVSKVVKDFGLDALAWTIVNVIIERMAAQTVNWINSGFDGSPGFITDTGGFFRETADGVAGQYIFDNPNLNFLCGPISAKIRLALAKNYIRDDVRWQCTITDVVDNVENFMNDFSQGGWDGFFELTQRQQNNPIGAYIQAENELMLRILSRQGVLDKELSWGQGIMSWKECTKTGVATSVTRYNLDGSSYVVSQPAPCVEEKINTPGSVIQSKLNETLGTGTKRLEVADEINEIVSALLTQLVSQVVGGVGKGLRSLSNPGSGQTSSQTFAELLLQGTTTDAVGTQQNTDILDLESPNFNYGIDPRSPDFCEAGDPYCVGNETPATETCDPLTDPNCTP